MLPPRLRLFSSPASVLFRSETFFLILVLTLLGGCTPAASSPGLLTPTWTTPTPAAVIPSVQPPSNALTERQIATLNSLKLVDEYPLYTLSYEGEYGAQSGLLFDSQNNRPGTSWACSLFAAFGDVHNGIYGRNFDWEYSPALLLFTHAPGAYASVSMVDMAYLGFDDEQTARHLLDLPLPERLALLEAPFLPFDGMNERGLAVGMAAVPSEPLPSEPHKQRRDSLWVMRAILDHASQVEEAVNILQSYNIDWGSGPALHYLVADRSGRAALVEFYQGKMKVFTNQEAWHLATNFLHAAVAGKPAGQCWRYDRIFQRLSTTHGRLSMAEAMAVLQSVSQSGTQWSIVYGLTSGDVQVTIGRHYASPPHTFHLEHP